MSNAEYDLYDQIESFTTRLTMNTMHFLMKRGEVLKIQEGTVIATEGEDSEHVYIIIDGEADVRKTDDQSNQVTIATLGPGHLVGEMGVFLNHKRSATIVAKSAMNVVKFTNKDFINALPKTPDLTLMLIKSLSDKVHVVNGRLADMAVANTMLILGVFVLERAKGTDPCEIALDVPEVVRETRIEQGKIIAALRSLHKRNLITKLNLVNGNTLVFEAKLSALRTYLKRIGAKS